MIINQCVKCLIRELNYKAFDIDKAFGSIHQSLMTKIKKIC